MLRGGVIGFGRMGVTHYAILNTHPDVELVAVCDSSSFVLKNLAQFASARVFKDFRQMLNEVEMDFIIISTPTGAHAEAIEAAVAEGLHLFVEKPLAVTAEEGQRLVAMLDGRELLSQVGYFLRFNEVFELVREIIRDGLLGRLVHYKSEMYGRTVLQASRTSWRSKRKAGGGCLRDFASHCIDLADYLFGPPARVEGCVLASVFSKTVEDAVYATLIYDNGVSGHLLVNWSDESYRRPYNRIELVGTHGRLVADRQECRLYLRKPDAAGRFRKGWTVKYLPELAKPVRLDIRGTEFTRQLDHFIDCILTGRRDTACSFADAWRTDWVIAQIENSHEQRKA